MIRFILTFGFLVIFLIVTIPVRGVEHIIGRFNPELRDKSSLAIVNWALRCCIFTSGVKVDYIGLENVPKDIAVMYVGNHRSYFDIILTYPKVPRLTGYISKKEMEKVPMLSSWMKLLHCLFLDRNNIKEGMKTILIAIDKLKNGISICIFPEGTRNKTADTFLEFHDGSFKIASKAGCPVVPITINNSAAIFEDQSPRIKKAHVIIEYGKPVYLNELPDEYKKRPGAYFQKLISETYFKNKELV